MGAFIDDLLLHTRKSIEDDCSSATFDIVHRGLPKRDGDEDGDGPSRDGLEGLRGRHIGKADRTLSGAGV